MPCIQTKLSTALSKEQEETLKSEFGQAISLFPGKSESWLMLSFEDRCRLWFRGENSQPAAFLKVEVFGAPNGPAFEKLTAELTKILNTVLGIAPDHVYVTYSALQHWGWNGSNF